MISSSALYFTKLTGELVTERSKHATDIARSLPLDFDAIVICSGDGILHEIYNGFAEHDDPMRAFSIPIAPVPTGSANGTCLNLLGLEVSASTIVYRQL